MAAIPFQPMMESRPIREIAYEVLKHAIITGEIPAGERIVETEYADRLHISRTPLREALRRLTTEGLLEALPKRGLRVTSPTEAEIAELFECRSMIEPPALAATLPRIPQDEIRSLLDRLESAAPEESLAVDEAMHRLVAEYCGNRFLREIILNLIRRSAPFRTMRTYSTPEEPKAERTALLAAMLEGDEEKSARLLAEHFHFRSFRADGAGIAPPAQPPGS